MGLKRTWLVAWLVLTLAAPAFAQMLPAATPETVGLARERLERVKTIMQDYVDHDRIAGIVTVVARGGKVVQFEAFGRLDVEQNVPMRKDAIFRMASMSKAVTSVATVMLIEEGRLLLSDPVSRHLQMLLNGGELDGVRLLGPKFVELMTSNHVGTLYSEGAMGFGLGFEVVEHVGRSGRPGSVGAFGWGSAYYSRYWVDPQEKLVAVFLSQLVPSGGLDLQEKFRSLVYHAVVGPVTGR